MSLCETCEREKGDNLPLVTCRIFRDPPSINASPRRVCQECIKAPVWGIAPLDSALVYVGTNRGGHLIEALYRTGTAAPPIHYRTPSQSQSPPQIPPPMSLCAICRGNNELRPVRCRISGQFTSAEERLICLTCRDKREWQRALIDNALVHIKHSRSVTMAEALQGTPSQAPAVPPIHSAPPPLHQPHVDMQGGAGNCKECAAAVTTCEAPSCRKKFCSKHLYRCTSTFNPQGDWRCLKHKTKWYNRGTFP